LRLNQLKTALLATAAGSILGYVLVGGSTFASAAVRHRSGAVHQQLADHVTAGRASDIVMTGADIMGVVVLLMAVGATLFLVTTFIRRRATVPGATVPGATVPVSTS
jgi:hypothetical protein